MTKQEIFDTVYTKLAAQGKRSMGGNICAYRADGTAQGEVRCGVGHLIKDGHYYGGLEGRLSNSPQVMGALIGSGVLSEGMSDVEYSVAAHFLQEVQLVHDNAERFSGDFVGNMTRAMRKVAHDFGLNTNVIPTEVEQPVVSAS